MGREHSVQEQRVEGEFYKLQTGELELEARRSRKMAYLRMISEDLPGEAAISRRHWGLTKD